LTVKSTKSNNFQPFQKPLRAKQPVDSTKQQVVFHLVGKTSILRKISIHISFRFNKRVDYTLIYPDPTHTAAATPAFHQTPWIWILEISLSLLINKNSHAQHPLAVRQMKYLVVAIEYYTKWIEVEPIAQITSHKVQRFVWKIIVCQFGIPRRLVSNNDTQLASQQLGKLCLELNIKQVFTSVEHPQTNGQVESANRVLLRCLKRRLEKAKGTWAEEVPRIVWAYHTTTQSTSKETHFSLVYWLDAMILVEIQESSPWFQNFMAEGSNEERKVNLDLLDEVRKQARIKAEAFEEKSRACVEVQVETPAVPGRRPGNSESSPLPVGE